MMSAEKQSLFRYGGGPKAALPPVVFAFLPPVSGGDIKIPFFQKLPTLLFFDIQR